MRKSLVMGFILIFLGLVLFICSWISFRNSTGFGVRHGSPNPVGDIAPHHYHESTNETSEGLDIEKIFEFRRPYAILGYSALVFWVMGTTIIIADLIHDRLSTSHKT